MRSVLVTGSSSGIGRTTATHLAEVGFKVFAGVRKEQDGKALKDASPDITPVIIDVVDQQSIEACAKEISEASPEGLFGLVNNAGISVNAPIEGLPLEELRKQLDVNVIGQIAVTQAFLPQIRKATGRVLFVSSVAARTPAVPFFGPYAASKFALEALADALRLELQPWNLKVSIIEPGAFDTAIWGKGYDDFEDLITTMPEDTKALYDPYMKRGLKIAKMLESRGKDPIEVARAIEDALASDRPKTRYLVGFDARIRAILENPVPDRIRDRVVGLLMGYKKKS
jgi:NAD(P)-dependent dehydrogenase (short-subunit alcohol dehydrogenase family)